MTELENILTQSLEKLSEQYKEDMTSLESQISNLAQQVQGLSEQNKTLIEHYNQVALLLKEELER